MTDEEFKKLPDGFYWVRNSWNEKNQVCKIEYGFLELFDVVEPYQLGEFGNITMLGPVADFKDKWGDRDE